MAPVHFELAPAKDDDDKTSNDMSKPDSLNSAQESSCFYFYHQTRIIVLLLSTLCLTLLHSNTLALNFTVICMDDVVAEQWTNSSDEPHWLQSPSSINSLFSAVAAGSLIGTLPVMAYVTRFGMRFVPTLIKYTYFYYEKDMPSFRKTLTIYGLISAVATLLTPLAVQTGYYFVFAVRLFQGFSIGIGFSAMGAITAQWSGLKEAGTYIAILSTHVQVGAQPLSSKAFIRFHHFHHSLQLCSIITMPLAGVLCESSFGWRSLYYIQGLFSVILFSTFYFFFQDSPSLHSNVSEKELSRIRLDKADFGVAHREAVPYLHVSKDPTIIGVWLSCIGANLGFFSLLYYGPVYVNKRIRIIIFGCISQGVLAFCFLLLALELQENEKKDDQDWPNLSMGSTLPFKTETASLARIIYTSAIVFSGLNVVGAVKCTQLVSTYRNHIRKRRARQHVHFVMAVWSRLFFGISAIVFVANVPFVFVARSDAAPWTMPGFVAARNKIAAKKPNMQPQQSPYCEKIDKPLNILELQFTNDIKVH
uniref:MFS domain-containing protein n=1 Tax=Nippostrongylus brasiliensis TaxID=27835 RepID=A0A0N4Y3L8_NIPBR